MTLSVTHFLSKLHQLIDGIAEEQTAGQGDDTTDKGTYQHPHQQGTRKVRLVLLVTSAARPDNDCEERLRMYG